MATHAEWLEQSKKIIPSEFGKKVANILGYVWQGLYHIQTTSLKKVKWGDERYMEIIISQGLATWDRNDLTELIVLCHDECIRLEIRPCSPQHLKLCFHKRVPISEAGDMLICRGHPTIEEQINKIRGVK